MGHIRKTQTHDKVRIALAQLLAEKAYDEITVAELAQRAGINRKTFYNNYTGIHMALEELTQQIADDFGGPLSDIDFMDLLNNPEIVFIKLGRLFQEKLLLYENLLRIPQNTLVYAKMHGALKEKLFEVFSENMNEAKFELAIDYHLTGIVIAYKSWVDKGMKEDIDELSRFLSVLVIHGIRGLFENES